MRGVTVVAIAVLVSMFPSASAEGTLDVAPTAAELAAGSLNQALEFSLYSFYGQDGLEGAPRAKVAFEDDGRTWTVFLDADNDYRVDDGEAVASVPFIPVDVEGSGNDYVLLILPTGATLRVCTEDAQDQLPDGAIGLRCGGDMDGDGAEDVAAPPVPTAPEACEEGASPSVAEPCIPAVPDAPGVPEACEEGASPSVAEPCIPAVPDAPGVPEACAEGASPSVAEPCIPAVPDAPGVPEACEEGASPSATNVCIPAAPPAGVPPPCPVDDPARTDASCIPRTPGQCADDEVSPPDVCPDEIVVPPAPAPSCEDEAAPACVEIEDDERVAFRAATARGELCPGRMPQGANAAEGIFRELRCGGDMDGDGEPDFHELNERRNPFVPEDE